MSSTFCKDERLSSRKQISALFKESEVVSAYPIKVLFKKSAGDSQFPCQVGIGVPKHRWKRAVDRNRLKRLIREAYRKHKNTLYTGLNASNEQLNMMILFTGKEKSSGTIIEERLITALGRLISSNVAHPK